MPHKFIYVYLRNVANVKHLESLLVEEQNEPECHHKNHVDIWQ